MSLQLDCHGPLATQASGLRTQIRYASGTLIQILGCVTAGLGRRGWFGFAPSAFDFAGSDSEIAMAGPASDYSLRARTLGEDPIRYEQCAVYV